jgi:hypothetical protein
MDPGIFFMHLLKGELKIICIGYCSDSLSRFNYKRKTRNTIPPLLHSKIYTLNPMYRLTTLFLVLFATLLVCSMAQPFVADGSSGTDGATELDQGDIERRSLLTQIVKAKIKHHLIKGAHAMKHGKKNKDLDKLNKLSKNAKSSLAKSGMGKMMGGA